MEDKSKNMPSKKVEFINKNGYKLSARLELPLSAKPDAYAVFAHVFTGSKNLISHTTYKPSSDTEWNCSSEV